MIRTTIIFIMAILFLFTLAINAQNPEIIKQKMSCKSIISIYI